MNINFLLNSTNRLKVMKLELSGKFTCSDLQNLDTNYIFLRKVEHNKIFGFIFKYLIFITNECSDQHNLRKANY